MAAAAVTSIWMGAGCGSAPDRGPSPPAGPIHVVVTDRVEQRIAGWGATVNAENDPLLDPRLHRRDLKKLDRLLFDKAGINLIRMLIPGYAVKSGTTAGLPSQGEPLFAFLDRLRRLGVRFMLTSTQAPALLMQGPVLSPDAAQGYARYVYGLLRLATRAREPFSYVAIADQPEGQRSVEIYPALAEEVYDDLARRMTGGPVQAKLVLGEDATWGITRAYARRELEPVDVRDRAGAIASHSYGGTARAMRSVARLARARGVPVWQTEWGSTCPTCRDDFSMRTALALSRQIADSLTYGRSSAWFLRHAVALPNLDPRSALIVRTRGRPRPFYVTRRFDVFRQYTLAAPPGSQRLATRVPGSGGLAVAFRSGGSTAVVVTNPASAQVPATIDLGSQTGTVRFRRTSRTERFVRLPPQRYGGKALRMDLPGQSVTTIILQGS